MYFLLFIIFIVLYITLQVLTAELAPSTLVNVVLGFLAVEVIAFIYMLCREVKFYLFYKSDKKRASLAQDSMRLRMSVLYLMADSKLHGNFHEYVLENMVHFINDTYPDKDKSEALNILDDLTKVQIVYEENRRDEHSIRVSVRSTINKNKILYRIRNGYFNIYEKDSQTISIKPANSIDGFSMAEELSKYLNDKERLYVAYSLLKVTDKNCIERLKKLCVDGLKLSEGQFTSMMEYSNKGELETWFNSNFDVSKMGENFFYRPDSIKTIKHTSCHRFISCSSCFLAAQIGISVAPNLWRLQKELMFHEASFVNYVIVMLIVILLAIIICFVTHKHYPASDKMHTLLLDNKGENEFNSRKVIMFIEGLNVTGAVFLFCIWINIFYLYLNQSFVREKFTKEVTHVTKSSTPNANGYTSCSFSPAINIEDLQLNKTKQPQLNENQQHTVQLIAKLKSLQPIDITANEKTKKCNLNMHFEDLSKLGYNDTMEVSYFIGYYNLPIMKDIPHELHLKYSN